MTLAQGYDSAVPAQAGPVGCAVGVTGAHLLGDAVGVGSGGHSAGHDQDGDR